MSKREYIVAICAALGLLSLGIAIGGSKHYNELETRMLKLEHAQRTTFEWLAQATGNPYHLTNSNITINVGRKP